MQELVQNAKAIRLPAAALGALAGVGVSYMATVFIDLTSYSLIVTLMTILLPIIVIGVIALILWIRKPLSGNDALLQEFVGYFEISFFFLYYATFCFLLLQRV